MLFRRDVGKSFAAASFVCLGLFAGGHATRAADGNAPFIHTVRSGTWSAASTWEGGKVPAAGARVRICRGHTVTYDVNSDQPIRMVHVAGTLRFASDRNTRLDAGLILIQPGEEASETGFDCDAHVAEPKPGEPRPALEVGSPEHPIDAKHTALIRLVYFPGMDKDSCPAIVCCGGRMDFHGAPMNRTWVKLGTTAKKGATTITLAEPVTGWRVGDRLIITATKLTHDIGQETNGYSTEERKIEKIDGTALTLDHPLAREHLGTGEYRGAAANLSRNVIVESADPKLRGHTMYHRGSAGSISYAEFRHLGKQGLLGRYALHYHLVGDTMRGSYVIGASIWDSGNRWLTVHGTNYLVVRDCVGYKSIGHGYYLEDGTEVFNVLDRNLAVQAFAGKRLPKQILPFDQNEGAGFWWANSLNTFTRNVSCENHRYGYRFEATRTSIFNLTLPVMQPDGKRRPVDIRTLPFVRFENNEAVCDGLYGFNLGEGVERVGPDIKHPFIIRNMKIWEVHYAFRPQSPNVLVENMQIHKAAYGVYHPNYDNHVYRNLLISATETEPFNRGHDDASVQYGKLAVDGLTFAKIRSGDYMPLIQISDDNPTGTAESHIRNLKLVDWSGSKRRAVVNLGGGPRPKPTTEKTVPVIVHDWFGPGRDARIVSTRSQELTRDGLPYREEPFLTGDESRVAEVKDVAFPQLLDPVDDLPPITVITHVTRKGKQWLVRGTTTDNGPVKRVLVNGQEAKALADNFAEWEVVLDEKAATDGRIAAYAEDAAGNMETSGHVLHVGVPQASPKSKARRDGNEAGVPENTAVVWDAATGAKLHVLRGHTDKISSVALSSDGRKALTGALDKTAIMWDVDEGAKIHTFRGHAFDVSGVAMSRDGRRLLTGSFDKTAILWNGDTGSRLRTLRGHGFGVWGVALTADGAKALTACYNPTAVLWNANDGAKLQLFRAHNAVAVALSADGSKLLTGSDDQTAILWDTATGKRIHTFRGHGEVLTAVALSADGSKALTGSDDRTAILWDTASGRQLQIFRGHGAGIRSVALGRNGRQVLTGSLDKTAILWDATRGAQLRAFRGHAGAVNGVALSGDGRRVLTGS